MGGLGFLIMTKLNLSYVKLMLGWVLTIVKCLHSSLDYMDFNALLDVIKSNGSFCSYKVIFTDFSGWTYSISSFLMVIASQVVTHSVTHSHFCKNHVNQFYFYYLPAVIQ